MSTHGRLNLASCLLRTSQYTIIHIIYILCIHLRFRFTPQTPHPQQPARTPYWLTAQLQQQQQQQPYRRQPRFDPDSFLDDTGPRPRPQYRPPTPYARDNLLPGTPYAPPTPLYQPQQPSYTPQPYTPWAPVIPPDYEDSDKEPESPLSGPPGPKNLQPRPQYWRSSYPNKRFRCPLSNFFSREDQSTFLHPQNTASPPSIEFTKFIIY